MTHLRIICHESGDLHAPHPRNGIAEHATAVANAAPTTAAVRFRTHSASASTGTARRKLDHKFLAWQRKQYTVHNINCEAR